MGWFNDVVEAAEDIGEITVDAVVDVGEGTAAVADGSAFGAGGWVTNVGEEAIGTAVGVAETVAEAGVAISNGRAFVAMADGVGTIADGSAFDKEGWMTTIVQESVPFGGFVTAGVHYAAGNEDYAMLGLAKGVTTGIDFATDKAALAMGGPFGAALVGAAGQTTSTIVEGFWRDELPESVKDQLNPITAGNLMSAAGFGLVSGGLSKYAADDLAEQQRRAGIYKQEISEGPLKGLGVEMAPTARVSSGPLAGMDVAIDRPTGFFVKDITNSSGDLVGYTMPSWRQSIVGTQVFNLPRATIAKSGTKTAGKELGAELDAQLGDMTGQPEDWYPDPDGDSQFRYWDGDSWTDWVGNNGETSTDPMNSTEGSLMSPAANGAVVADMTGQPEDWYPDPGGDSEFRYWDGEGWTDWVGNDGESTTDPLPQQAEAAAVVADMTGQPEDWYPDPGGDSEFRYWDGEGWTDWVGNDGESTTDPLVDAVLAETTDVIPRFDDSGGTESEVYESAVVFPEELEDLAVNTEAVVNWFDAEFATLQPSDADWQIADEPVYWEAAEPEASQYQTADAVGLVALGQEDDATRSDWTTEQAAENSVADPDVAIPGYGLGDDQEASTDVAIPGYGLGDDQEVSTDVAVPGYGLGDDEVVVDDPVEGSAEEAPPEYDGGFDQSDDTVVHTGSGPVSEGATPGVGSGDDYPSDTGGDVDGDIEDGGAVSDAEMGF